MSDFLPASISVPLDAAAVCFCQKINSPGILSGAEWRAAAEMCCGAARPKMAVIGSSGASTAVIVAL